MRGTGWILLIGGGLLAWWIYENEQQSQTGTITVATATPATATTPTPSAASDNTYNFYPGGRGGFRFGYRMGQQAAASS